MNYFVVFNFNKFVFLISSEKEKKVMIQKKNISFIKNVIL